MFRPSYFVVLTFDTEKRRISWENGSGGVAMTISTYERMTSSLQIVPHVTNAIQDWIDRVSKIPVDNSGEEPDLCIVEVRAIVLLECKCLKCSQLGGTVGDIESAPFIEAMRQFQFRVGHDNFALIHVSLVPDMHGEQKTKPTQTTVHALRGLGLLPDLVSNSLYVFFTKSSISIILDCLSTACTQAIRKSHQGEDLHVLPCRIRASGRRA